MAFDNRLGSSIQVHKMCHFRQQDCAHLTPFSRPFFVPISKNHETEGFDVRCGHWTALDGHYWLFRSAVNGIGSFRTDCRQYGKTLARSRNDPSQTRLCQTEK